MPTSQMESSASNDDENSKTKSVLRNKKCHKSNNKALEKHLTTSKTPARTEISKISLEYAEETNILEVINNYK